MLPTYHPRHYLGRHSPLCDHRHRTERLQGKVHTRTSSIRTCSIRSSQKSIRHGILEARKSRGQLAIQPSKKSGHQASILNLDLEHKQINSILNLIYYIYHLAGNQVS